MKTKEELREIYEGLNDSEKFGIEFALFPAKLQGLSREEVLILMQIREEERKKQSNNSKK